MRITRRDLSLFVGMTLAASLTAGSVIAASAEAAPAVGQPAPAFTVTDTAGVTHELSDFADKTVVLEWINPGCPYVRKHYDSANMQGLQADAGADEVVWIAVNSTNPDHKDYLTPAEMDAWMVEQNAAATAMVMDEDGALARLYDARTTPHMFIIENGTLVYNGAIDSTNSTNPADIPTSTNYVTAALTAIASGQTPEPAETKAYGCSVKL